MKRNILFYESRIAVAGVLLSALVPLATYALVMPEEKVLTEQSLNEAISDAMGDYQSGRGLVALQQKQTELVRQAERRVWEVSKQKREYRLQAVALKKELAKIGEQYGFDTSKPEVINRLVDEERAQISSFLRYLNVSNDSTDPGSGGMFGVMLLRRMLIASLGDYVETDQRNAALRDAHLRLFVVFADAQQKSVALKDTMTSYDTALSAYWDAEAGYRDALAAVQLTESRRLKIQQTVEEVHEHILKMQSQLARIDARIRAKAERDLISQGLLNEGSQQAAVSAGPDFAWPAYARITATFLDPTYQSFFGIQHLGMDIAVPQASPIFAAADGVVFFVRDGGETGYSYVLVGHRDGYATLYGHLSSFSVKGGDYVRKGQKVGLSGGTPGTRGAGYTTTGPHLHLEVLKGGVNIDPKSVLP